MASSSSIDPRRVAGLPTGPIVTSTTVVELRPERGSPHRVMMLLAGAESSFLDLTDPSHLEFEYMQHIRAVLDAHTPAAKPLRLVHLGGAGCALPRALDADRPGSRQLVVEYDADLARLVREWFDLPRSPAMRLRVAEARSVVGTLRPGRVDALVRDVFVDGDVPRHVMTQEFAAETAAAVGEYGIYLVNLTDRKGLNLTRYEAAALRTSFKYVIGICDPGVRKGRRLGNVVLVATQFPLDVSAIDRELRKLVFPVTTLDEAELGRLVRTTQPLRDLAAASSPTP